MSHNQPPHILALQVVGQLCQVLTGVGQTAGKVACDGRQQSRASKATSGSRVRQHGASSGGEEAEQWDGGLSGWGEAGKGGRGGGNDGEL